jgi:hypothetical protein
LHILQPQTAAQGLGIGDLAATHAVQQLVSRHAADIEKLVGIELALARSQAAREKM